MRAISVCVVLAVLPVALWSCGGTIRTWAGGGKRPPGAYSVLLMGRAAIEEAPRTARGMASRRGETGVAYMVSVVDSSGSTGSEDNLIGLIKERYELVPGETELSARCFSTPPSRFPRDSASDPALVLTTGFSAEPGRTYAAFCGYGAEEFYLQVADVTAEVE